jgi:superfamily II DNA or RNA helicase
LTYSTNLIRTIQKSGIVVCTFSTIKFGEEIYKRLTNKDVNKVRNSFELQKEAGVFFISGKTKSSIREKIRQHLNSDLSSNEILIAQTTTMDTGINIPKLKHFVFLEQPGKSFTKILQSIGRVMRKADASGDNVFVWDIVDCFDYAKENYSLTHFWERLKYYENEGHPVTEKEINLL